MNGITAARIKRHIPGHRGGSHYFGLFPKRQRFSEEETAKKV
jgi:hypothetical protein